MSELAELYWKVHRIVHEQEPVVINIEQKGEESHDDVVQANTEISGAIEKARSSNIKSIFHFCTRVKNCFAASTSFQMLN